MTRTFQTMLFATIMLTFTLAISTITISFTLPISLFIICCCLPTSFLLFILLYFIGLLVWYKLCSVEGYTFFNQVINNLINLNIIYFFFSSISRCLMTKSFRTMLFTTITLTMAIFTITVFQAPDILSWCRFWYYRHWYYETLHIEKPVDLVLPMSERRFYDHDHDHDLSRYLFLYFFPVCRILLLHLYFFSVSPSSLHTLNSGDIAK